MNATTLQKQYLIVRQSQVFDPTSQDLITWRMYLSDTGAWHQDETKATMFDGFTANLLFVTLKPIMAIHIGESVLVEEDC